MRSAIVNMIENYKRDERGVIAIIFALTTTAVLMTAGLAIDIGRAVHANTKISAAIDAAALAAAKGLRLQNLTAAEAKTLAAKMFAKNFATGGQGFAKVNSLTVNVDAANSSVEVKVDAEVKTVFAQFAGFTKLVIPKSSVAVYDMNDIEVSLQLDVTGSMSGSKIADLKAATKDLVDILIPDNPGAQKVRIGYAPFAAGVNAGTYANLVNGGTSAPNACVYERKVLGFQNTDNFPTGSAALKTKNDLPLAMNCSSAKILAMTDDKAVLKSTVDSYSVGGYTAGHLGTAWAWYLLSPSWSAVWPSASRPVAYNDDKTIKIAILMTDGVYNTHGGSNGQSTASNTDAVNTCAAMKAKGIIVYTVGFKLNNSTAKATLNTCASGPTKFFEAENGAALKAAFRLIAEDITQLRLSK